jgi:HPt (histidine-containing phosphotransfer) domain-containing protein
MDETTGPGERKGDNWIDEATIAKLHAIGDESFVVEMIDTMLAFVPRVMSEARAALLAGNLEPVFRMGHSLKSSAQSFGAERMRVLAIDIERRARNGETDALPGLLDEMERVFGNVRTSLLRVRNERRKQA